MPFSGPLSSTTSIVTDVKERETIQATEYIENDNDFDDEFDVLISDILNQTEDIPLPEDLNLQKILDDIEIKNEVTKNHQNINKIVKEVDQIKYKQFCHKEHEKYVPFLSKFQDQEMNPISTSQQGKFYSDVHQHTTSLEFRMNCMSFFDTTSFTEDHLDICISISNSIRNYLLRKVAAKFPTSNRSISHRHVSISSHARIRYIAGYCLAKVRHKFVKKKSHIDIMLQRKDKKNIVKQYVVCNC